MEEPDPCLTSISVSKYSGFPHNQPSLQGRFRYNRCIFNTLFYAAASAMIADVRKSETDCVFFQLISTGSGFIPTSSYSFSADLGFFRGFAFPPASFPVPHCQRRIHHPRVTATAVNRLRSPEKKRETTGYTEVTCLAQ